MLRLEGEKVVVDRSERTNFKVREILDFREDHNLFCNFRYPFSELFLTNDVSLLLKKKLGAIQFWGFFFKKVADTKMLGEFGDMSRYF